MALESPVLCAASGTLASGVFTPSAAITGYRTFSAALSASDTVDVTLRDSAGEQAFYPGSTWSGSALTLGAETTPSGTITDGDVTVWAVGSTPAGRTLQTAVDAAAQRTALGLGTAAAQDVDAFATGAEGDLAATALQPGDIDTLAELNAIIADATLIDTSDARLSDARTPTTHASTHGDGGSDEITITSAQISDGEAVFQTWTVTQAAHGFTAVGEPVYFDGADWVAAQAATEATIHTAVIASIPDIDTLVLQQSGNLTGIDFVILTPGEFYYLTDAGGLSTTPGTISAPVLQAITSTSAIILPWQAGDDITWGTTGAALAAAETPYAAQTALELHLPVHGIVPYWISDSEIGWSAGHAQIEGVMVVYSAGTTGALGQSDAGLSAQGCWLHWLQANGTILMSQESAGAPVWNSTYWYWQRSTDATKRLIGWHICWDNSGTRMVLDFNMTDAGRTLEGQWPVQSATGRLQSGLGSAVSNSMEPTTSSITIGAPSIITDALLAFKIQAPADTVGEWTGRLANRDMDSLSSGASSTAISVRAPVNSTGVVGYLFFPPCWLNLSPSNKTIYYGFANIGASPNPNALIVDLCGARITR